MDESRTHRMEGFYRVRRGQSIVHGEERFGGGERVPAGHPCVGTHKHLLAGDPEDPPRAVAERGPSEEPEHERRTFRGRSAAVPPPDAG